MDEPQSLDAEFLTAVLVEAVRSGIIPADIIEKVGDRFEAEAEAAEGLPDRQERFETLAMMAAEVSLAAVADASSDQRARKRRGQIVDITSRLQRP